MKRGHKISWFKQPPTVIMNCNMKRNPKTENRTETSLLEILLIGRRRVKDTVDEEEEGKKEEGEEQEEEEEEGEE